MASVERPRVSDPLWVPLLTHYRQDGTIGIDQDRMAAHVDAIRPQVWQFLLGGSTGDGWEFDGRQFADLVCFARDRRAFQPHCRVLFGVLRRSTDEVVAWATALERMLADDGPPAAQFDGIAVCPPVDPAASQDDIFRHYERVIAATHCPIAVYQLPQVTGCTIAPEAMQQLAKNPRVTMFKDTSGEDTVAEAGATGDVVLVRGAEGGYAEALTPHGPYDGWLLSTANAFAPQFRRLLHLRAAGETAQAQQLSDRLSRLIEDLFKAAADVPFGNAFSNANRAADHLFAYGASWPSAPAPLTISGDRLPHDLLRAAADILVKDLDGVPQHGYLAEQ
jgi:dihydrodipicolinate synthase/N-acetylneuraminate lyase